MKSIKQLINNQFIPPKKVYYFGKLSYGTPYFYPWSFNSTIIGVRKLALKTDEEANAYTKQYPWNKDKLEAKFNKVPMVRRTKYWIKKIFGNYYLIDIGWPIMIKSVKLGWKDKWNFPRHEWSPAFQILFFKWQFCIFWKAPFDDDDKYWEMILWYANYCDYDIVKAKETWGWIDYETQQSTWNDKYVKNGQ